MANYKDSRLYDGAVSIGFWDSCAQPEALEKVDVASDGEDREDKSDELYFTIFLDEQVVGSIELHDISMEEMESLIGYRIFDTANHNKGIGTKALNLLKEYAIAELRLESLIVITEADNLGSRRICEKCGFRYIGTAREGDHLAVYECRTA